MHPAAAHLLATVLLAAPEPTPAPTPSPSAITGTGTLAIALVGALSAIVVALIPELFKALRSRGAPLPPAVVTPQAMEALADQLRAETEARIASVRSTANSARSEVRALRGALERRDEAWRDRIEAVRDDLQRHEWGVHGVAPPGSGAPPVLPGPREPEPA